MPLAARPIVSTTTMCFGALYAASVVFTWAITDGGVDGVAGASFDHAGDRFAELLVGDADGDGIEHVGMGLHRLLDLFGKHLLAAGVDALRSAAEQGDPAVGVDRGEVAGARVALAVDLEERAGALLGVLVVADRLTSSDGKSPDLAGARLRAGG